MVVPEPELLREELMNRCVELELEAGRWVRAFRLGAGASISMCAE
jgi:hypothetical protein